MDATGLLEAQELKQRDGGVSMCTEDVDRFLESLLGKGRAPQTVERYRRSLVRLARVLPEDGRIRRGTLARCRDALLAEGAAPRSVNLCVSAANSYAAYMGHPEYQLRDMLRAEAKLQPELTRAEYRHLLRTAKLLDREKAYLLVKLFASADLPVQELESVTYEAALAGQTVAGRGKGRRVVRLPRCLSQELLDYAGRNGIYVGPLFLTKEGRPMDRSYVTGTIRELCAAASVPVEKGSPRCLRRLYLAGRKAIEDNVALLVDQALERQMEEEQLLVGWRA